MNQMPSKIPVSQIEYTAMAKVTGEGSLLTQLQNMQSLLIIQDPFIFQKLEVYVNQNLRYQQQT